MKKLSLSAVSVVIYWLIFIFLLGMYFTNDFGLVDIHKTSIITAVAIDCPEEEVLVTAEVAVPQPSQSGENIKYTQVQGSGLTIADALNEINAKTGFYPKLQFCKLILIGETCRDNKLFRVLGCFYRKNYSELTALVATCDGNASDMLSMKSTASDMTSEAIRNVLSDEIEKSANATSANLKSIAMSEYSKSGACYMPLVEASKPGTSEGGGNGDNVGGESQSSGGSSGESGGSGGGEESGGGSGSQGQKSGSGSGGGSEEPVEFSARKTACFSRGKFVGILNEQQSFALAVLCNDIRLAVLPCDTEEGVHYTLGLKNVDSGIGLSVDNGVPVVKISFSASAQIQGARVVVEPQKIISDDVVPKPVLDGANKELTTRIENLVKSCVEGDCDLLGLKEQLYKYHNKYFEAFKDDLLKRIKVEYDINITSVN